MSAVREDFEAFVAARYAALLRTAYLLTGDHHDAEDLLQQTLVKAVGAWRRIEGDPEPYVRKILVRQNVSRWRARRWRELPTDAPPETAVADEASDDRVALHRALGVLAPRQRAVIVLRYYEDLTEVQTAEALGITVGTVKSQTRDALRRLRDALPELADVLVSP
ncbi:SigE family RNA polymerase sigma factor [Nocardioides sp.]|uniref:SigE family RNA polymerase sigma factor n=1 Tax=Nocardioides sp. TaxID=35761 RepID=UPI002F425493